MNKKLGNNDFDTFIDSLNGAILKKRLEKLNKSKKLSIQQLKKLYYLGIKLYSTMQLKEAEMVFLAYSTLSPYDHRGPGCLASIYLEKNEYEKALDVLNIVKTYPTCDLDEVFLNISFCHYHLNEYENSEVALVIVQAGRLSEFYKSRYLFLQNELNIP